MLHCENKAKLVIGKYRRTGTVRPEGGGRGGVPLLYFTRYFKTYLWFSSSDAFYSIHLGGLASAGCCYVRTKCQIARARWPGRSRRALGTWWSMRSRKALATIVTWWSYWTWSLAYNTYVGYLIKRKEIKRKLSIILEWEMGDTVAYYLVQRTPEQ